MAAYYLRLVLGAVSMASTVADGSTPQLRGVPNISGHPADLLSVPEQTTSPPGSALQAAESARVLAARRNYQKISDSEKKVSSQISWAAVMKAVNKLFMADYCWKDVWVRGAAERVCKPGWYRGRSGLDSGLCYQNCPHGYRRFGDHCWQDCPRDYNDVGTHCQKEQWGWPPIKAKKKDVKYKPGCSLLSGTCTQCPSGHYAHGALCYKEKDGYQCIGGDLTCRRKCSDSAPLTTDCVGACALDTESCLSNTGEIISGVVEAALNTALLVASFGSSASATAMGSATRASIQAAARKSARRNAVMVSKQAFQKELKKTYKDIIKKAVKDAIKGKLEEKREELLVNYAVSEADSLAEYFTEKVKKEGDDPALIVVKEIDPTGLAAAIDSSIKNEDSANSQAAKWMNVFSVVDPTGILGAVANFIKHDHCESTVVKMSDAASSEIEVPATNDPLHYEQVTRDQYKRCPVSKQVSGVAGCTDVGCCADACDMAHKDGCRGFWWQTRVNNCVLYKDCTTLEGAAVIGDVYKLLTHVDMYYKQVTHNENKRCTLASQIQGVSTCSHASCCAEQCSQNANCGGIWWIPSHNNCVMYGDCNNLEYAAAKGHVYRKLTDLDVSYKRVTHNENKRCALATQIRGVSTCSHPSCCAEECSKYDHCGGIWWLPAKKNCIIYGDCVNRESAAAKGDVYVRI